MYPDTWLNRLAATLALGLLAGCASLPSSDTEGRALLLGHWYGEYACGGGCADRDLLRWTRINAPDGTQRVHFRYTLRGKVVENVVRTGRWGYEGGTYWLTCETYEVEGRREPCPDSRYDFVVESLDAGAMRYRSDKYRIRYEARRVADDFRMGD